jgi:formamidopyrimidine-DNA glycosylase
MPELPEVQTTVNGLNKKVLSRTFVDVWSGWPKTVKKPKNFEDFKKEIKNKKIKKIWRRAKNVIFDLSDGCSLLVHQKMTGHLLVGKWILKNNIWKPEKEGPLNDPYNRFLHLIFFLDNGLMLALSDARKFAKVELWKTEDLKKELEKIGPEPLEKYFTFEKFKEIFKNKKGRIKQIIMDQGIIAGIGNIYASEALWQAKIHPEKSVAKLSAKELKSLYNAIKKVLELGVKLGGESFSDYRKPDGTKGDFDTERKAYKREGQKCIRCGTKIKRIKVAQRSAFFCPHCQKL